jgi:hypothetical protein
MDGGPMTDTEPLDGTSVARSAIARQVMEALKSGAGLSALRPLLEDTSLLSPEQREVIEFLEFFDEFEESPTVDADTNEYPNQRDSAELQALRDEVTDLREVNDAAAAALGACRVCWGGDDFCPVCAGHGRPGASLPDLRLYNELVEPAVERMTAAHGVVPQSIRFPEEEAQQ